MIVARSVGDVTLNKNSVLSVGTFDGMHRGHCSVLREVQERAEARGGRSVMVTFDPHPRQVLQNGKDAPAILSTLEERLSIAESLGIDVALVLAFTPEFSRISFREFYQTFIVGGIGVSEVVEGYDHHFGRDRKGSVEVLHQLGREFGFSVVALNPVSVDGEVVSSSGIRTHLQEGRVARAAVLLGRPYLLSGRVVRGNGRGRRLGYPTANLQLPDPAKAVPRNGIYFVDVTVQREKAFGVASVGVRPTFETDGRRVVEVYYLDFDRDIYDETVSVGFRERLRDALKFETPEDLIHQMHKDKQQALQLRAAAEKDRGGERPGISE